MNGPWPDDWSDFEIALFLLDHAEQCLVEDFHTSPTADAAAFLQRNAERIRQLRRDYVLHVRR